VILRSDFIGVHIGCVYVVFQRSKWTPLNVDISNTTVPIHTGIVASERKLSWPRFRITILGAGKYHDYVITSNQSFKKPVKVKIFIFGFDCDFRRNWHKFFQNPFNSCRDI
jgi:hypothetical protein